MKIFTISHNPENGETLFHEDGVLAHSETRKNLALEDLISIAGSVIGDGIEIGKKIRKSRKTATQA